MRDFVAKEIKPNADSWDEAGKIPWDLHQRVGALGVWGFYASEAMQVISRAAYLHGHPVERIYREVKVMTIGGGSEEIMHDLAVRQMDL